MKKIHESTIGEDSTKPFSTVAKERAVKEAEEYVEPAAPRRIRGYERGTISVKHERRPEDANWHGHAPRPVPETNRLWRPSEFRL